MSPTPSTSAAQRPLQFRVWRRRAFWAYLLLGSFLFSLIAVVLIGGTRLSQYERKALKAIEAAKQPPLWCVDLAAAQATEVRTFPHEDIFAFPDGPTWWLAQQVYGVIGQHTGMVLRSMYRNAQNKRQTRCPYLEPHSPQLPSKTCSNDESPDPSICHQWGSVFYDEFFSALSFGQQPREGADPDAAPSSSVTRTDAKSTPYIVRYVLGWALQDLSKGTRTVQWQHWRDDEALQKKLAVYIDAAFRWTDGLAPSQRRDMVFAALREGLFVDEQIAGLFRLHFAQTAPLLDCRSLTAVAAETRSEIIEPLDWSSLPRGMRVTLHRASQTETAQAASATLAQHGCTGVVDFVDAAETPCDAIARLARTIHAPHVTRGLAQRYACAAPGTQ